MDPNRRTFLKTAAGVSTLALAPQLFAARSADSITERMPDGSVATGFSQKTCLPASTAALR